MSSIGTPPKRTTKKRKRKCSTLGRTTEMTDISKTTAAEYIRRLFCGRSSLAQAFLSVSFAAQIGRRFTADSTAMAVSFAGQTGTPVSRCYYFSAT
jgi:hypothetical protein